MTTSGAAELGVGGIQQPGVLGLGKALALIAASAAGVVHAVDQPGSLPGLDGDQRGQRHPRVVPAGHPHDEGGAAAAPGTALGRP
jgi:hypothetical protein